MGMSGLWLKLTSSVQYRFGLRSRRLDTLGNASYPLGTVSLSQIRYFVAVAEESHVGRAAQRLHVAQPPVSRQIRALEEEIGAQLFERTSRGMHLLPQGRVFLEHARSILAALDSAIVATRAESRLPRRDATLGVT
jgi:DNA-binding transcriptional LysR family regulator